MPYQYSAFKHIIIVKYKFSDLSIHFADSSLCDLGIVGSGGISLCRIRGQIFQIRHIYLHKPLKAAEHLDVVITRTVPHDGDRELCPLKCRGYLRHIVRACDKVNVVNALVLKLKKNITEPFNAHGFSCLAAAYLVVLTKNAP